MLLALSLLNFVFRTLPSSVLCNVISRGMTLRSFYPSFKVFRILGYTVEPQYSEGPRDWQNVFAIRKFGYMKVLSCIFYY